MKNLIIASCYILFLSMFSITGLRAQSEGNVLYFQLDYMKVAPEKISEYLELEQEIFKPIHQERVKRNLVNSWNLYQVMYNPPGAGYNYVTVNSYDNFEKLENSYPQDILSGVHPSMSFDNLMDKVLSARELVHTEIWQLIEMTGTNESGNDPGNYLVVNYMTVEPGKEGDYIDSEMEIWKPIHQARIDQNMMKNWGTYRLLYPSGKVMNYNFATVDSYQDLKSTQTPFFTEEIMKKAHANAKDEDFQKMGERTNAARTMYNTVMWKRIDGN